jgi:hypothetical protein
VPAAAIVAVLAAPGAARAAKYDIKFRPRIELRTERTGSASGVDGAGDRSDDTITLNLGLALDGSRPGSSWNLSYSPARQNFNDFSQFDNTQHQLTGSFTRTASDLSSFTVRVTGSQVENNSGIAEEPTANESLPRTKTLLLNGGVNGRTQAGQRSFITWQASGGRVERDDLPGQPLEDSTTVGALLGWGRQISQKSTLAVQAGQQRIEFEFGNTNRSTQLRVNASRQFSETWQGQAAVGVVDTRTVSDGRTEPGLELSLNGNKPTGQIRVGLRQAVSAGTGQTGSTIDTGLFATWARNSRNQRWRGRIAASYWKRESVETTQGLRPGIDTLRTDADLSWEFAAGFSAGLSHRYNLQDRLESQDQTTFQSDFHSGSVYVRWSPGQGRAR